MSSSVKLDIVLVGATGFTGALVARWLCEHAPTSLRWALAGRSLEKLEKCKTSLLSISKDRTPPEIIVVDTQYDEQCSKLTQRTSVVITTVGPYAILGEALLKACAKNGTHYCDLTGELPFVKSMIEKYQVDARQSGSVIICCSGFDSIPVDLCNFVVARYIQKHYRSGTANARTVLTRIQGGASGGTLLSVLSLMDMYSLKEVGAAHKPWGISDKRGSDRQSNTPHVTYDRDLKAYGASWVGDSVDRNIAARSWSFLDYGADWTTYGYLSFTSAWKAYLYLGCLYTAGLLITLSPIRYLLKKVVTQPGSGPTQKEMDNGYVQIKCIAESDREPNRRAVATFDINHADPGYKGTAMLLGSVGLTLAFDIGKTFAGQTGEGGFYTPACLGDSLISRLADTGITLDVQSL